MELQQVQELLKTVEELTDHQAKCYVAGGYLRDLENGLAPKDVDIMVTPTDGAFLFDSEEFAETLKCLDFYTITKNLTELCHYLSDMEDRGVTGLVMGNYKETDVQFIFYGEERTQEFITHDMDMNICQISMGSDGNIMKSDAFEYGFKHNKLQLLHDYSEERKEQRVQRMLDKYPHMTFEG